jgi:hypothetical protein
MPDKQKREDGRQANTSTTNTIRHDGAQPLADPSAADDDSACIAIDHRPATGSHADPAARRLAGAGTSHGGHSAVLVSVVWLWFLLWALFRGCAMASAAQQQELQRLFADYPELHAYRDRVAALGRGFTVGEHETLMAWPAMKAGIADDLDSAV